MIIARKCDNCQEEYNADTRELNRGNGIYCSKECSYAGRSKKTILRKEQRKPNVTCAYCGVMFYREARFQKGSKSGLFFCSRQHQGLGFSSPDIDVKSGPSATGKTRKICHTLKCNNSTRNDYCRQCTKQQIIEKWLSGDLSVTWCMTTKEPKDFIKKYLVETRGDKCEQCGFDEKAPDGRSIIQMDHIDGDYTNNLITNLKLLCPNHHAMTSTYGSKNKNGGRRYRSRNPVFVSKTQ